MKISAKTVLLALLALVVVGVAGLLTSVGWEVVLGPKARPVTDRTFDATEARLARGRYLVEGPAHCFHCHSEHDLASSEFPTIAQTRGGGWELPEPSLGRLYAPNITSDSETGIGGWSDDEIARAIQEGVSRDGRALFPVMPYFQYAQLDEEDIASIIVYLRTVPPVRKPNVTRELVFPLEYIVKTIPEPLTEPSRSHPSSTPVERGRYLATVADCTDCHTPSDANGEPLPGLAFGGGMPFVLPGADPVFSMNITPDPSGIAHYDEAFFLDVVKSGRLPARMLNHVMPFEFYRNMTDDDLRDLFAFLQSLPPVRHRISNDDPPRPCAVCGQSHGLGELNGG